MGDPDAVTGPDSGPPAVEARSAVMLVGGFCAVLIAALAALLPVRYAILQPGPVVNTLGMVGGKPLIAVEGRRTYPPKGQLDLTTVSVVGGPGRQVTLVQVIQGWLDPTSAVVPREQVFPDGQTQEESDAENQAEMVSSQESATAAALSALGVDVPTTLTVAGVQESAPAAGVLRRGDVVREVDGTPIADLAQLREVLQSTRAGDDVEVRVQRGGTARTLRAGTVASQDDGRTVLGVYIDPTFRFPFKVTIRIEDIGGPSAGLMFALGIVDTLTPGDLTGGRRIAGTGTIDADGSVGPIGGIRQKLVGARRAGAESFLAPAGNCGEVRRHVPDGLRVYRVATLDDAQAAVEAIAGRRTADLATC